MKKRIRIIGVLLVLILTACDSKDVEKQENKELVSQEIRGEEKEETKIIGGANIVKKDNVVELGGVLGKLESLADNLNVEEISKMSREEQQEIVGNLEILQGKQNVIVNHVNKALEKMNIEVDDKTGKIIMPDSILFGKNEDSISEEGKIYLDSFFKIYTKTILDESISGDISEIQVIGNTDTDGTYEYNKILSERRAKAVWQYCLESEENGLTKQEREAMEKLMVVIGNSFDNPIYNESGVIDKDASRRVEIKFILNVN